MAAKRGSRKGSGGFRPPELRGTLGTLINTALSQAGVVRSALERGAREGKSRIDEARNNRRRHDALAELGEILLGLIRDAEIDLAELPEARDIVRHLDELDGEEAQDLDEVVRPQSRARFDDRRRDDNDDGTVSSAAKPWTAKKPAAPARVWRPVDPEPEPETAPPSPPARDRRLPNNPVRKGGIAFDDEDLAEYMHPDDVPPKPPTDGDA
jgi:hypothetical protein